jgi:hypothetical protein
MPADLRPKTADEVRAEIAKAREQIQSSVVALREQVTVASDWRRWVRRRPGLFIGGCFALGFYLGYRD